MQAEMESISRYAENLKISAASPHPIEIRYAGFSMGTLCTDLPVGKQVPT